ncbi:RNA polymerase II subunit 5-mediating protein-like protein [Nymphaea thermarum]|nr:RNA polymerase II subunit 5-mediating protein-like protein [Nymphaea thermarum]
MEGREKGKGIATPIASLFSVDEAQKAAQWVNDSIAERQKELDQLNAFIADNNALKKLVQKLPDELSHDIMVLLGEGYYAERTAKQTVEILQRRGKTLQSQVEALKATIRDLQAEASFFNSTAAEAAQCGLQCMIILVLRKIIGTSKLESLHLSEDGNDKKLTQNEEFDRLMSRLDELEKEEDQDGNSSMSSDEDTRPESSVIESQLEDIIDLSTVQNRTTQGRELEKLQLQFSNKVEPSEGNDGAIKPRKFDEKVLNYPRLEEKRHVSFAPQNDVSDAPVEDNTNTVGSSHAPKARLLLNAFLPLQCSYAFTGSIIERGFETPSSPSQGTGSSQERTVPTSSSKPVSRFKMQRGSRC